MAPTKEEIKRWLESPAAPADLRAQIVASPTTPHLLDAIRREIDDQAPIPALTYTLYRTFEHEGTRGPYEEPYFFKRARLTRAVLELLAGDDSAQIGRAHVELQ